MALNRQNNSSMFTYRWNFVYSSMPCRRARHNARNFNVKWEFIACNILSSKRHRIGHTDKYKNLSDQCKRNLLSTLNSLQQIFPKKSRFENSINWIYEPIFSTVNISLYLFGKLMHTQREYFSSRYRVESVYLIIRVSYKNKGVTNS